MHRIQVLNNSNIVDVIARIEQLVWKDDLTYFEAIVEVAEGMDKEVEEIAKLLPKPIKEKLLSEASKLRLIKPEYRVTPLYGNE